KSERDRDSDETRHEVILSDSFFLGETEVTQGHYLQIMNTNPCEFGQGNLLFPVERVSWEDATEFCRRLTRQEHKLGRLPLGMNYRLPTEAQWEYACRAGTTSAFAFGESLSTNDARFDLGVDGSPVQVASFRPNAWGLFDMHGNLWEWCQDWYDKYPTNHVENPAGLLMGSDRVIRGGSWIFGGRDCRSADRLGSSPSDRNNFLGFRVAAVQSGKGQAGRMPGMQLVWCEPGRFAMGSPEGEPDRDPDEIQHSVSITHRFGIGKYEVTQGEYQSLMGNNPSHFTTSGTNAPVENVSWNQAVEFCHKLSNLSS
ncbi:MAG: SUMF1/EgtB/PvdO family nonheme iron enzyme, partial [Verrucomicrobiota bacterium]